MGIFALNTRWFEIIAKSYCFIGCFFIDCIEIRSVDNDSTVNILDFPEHQYLRKRSSACSI